MGLGLDAQLWWDRQSGTGRAPELHSYSFHSQAESVLLCAAVQRCHARPVQAGSAARDSMVLTRVQRAGTVRVAISLAGDAQREADLLSATGRLRHLSDLALAVRHWKEAPQAES